MKNFFIAAALLVVFIGAPQIAGAEKFQEEQQNQNNQTSGTGGGMIFCSSSSAPGWNVSVDNGGCMGGTGAYRTTNAVGQVAGASTERCEPYLVTYLRIGWSNDAEQVRKLQTFLNTHMQAGLAVSGVFDQATFNAVSAFQKKYPAEVLSPWNITEPTGYVYITTTKQINALMCAAQ